MVEAVRFALSASAMKNDKNIGGSSPASLNLYSYCNGNPVLSGDPTGHITEEQRAINYFTAWYQFASNKGAKGISGLTAADTDAAFDYIDGKLNVSFSNSAVQNYAQVDKNRLGKSGIKSSQNGSGQTTQSASNITKNSTDATNNNTNINWLNQIPIHKTVIKSSDQIVGAIANTVTGAASSVLNNSLNKDMTKGHYYIDESNIIRYQPGEEFDVTNHPLLSEATKTVGFGITVATSTLDIANTWTENNNNNNNTNMQRIEKTSIQIGGVIAGIGVGYLAIAAANAWNPLGWGMLAGFAVGVVGALAISEVENKSYKALNIE